MSSSRRERTLENDLVDDAAAGTPELDAILAGSRLQKVEHLLVACNRTLQGNEQLSAFPLTHSRFPAAPKRTLRSASAPEKALMR